MTHLRASLPVVLIQLSSLLYGNPIDRLIVLRSSETDDSVVHLVSALQADFRTFFGVTDIRTISMQGWDPDALLSLCQDPEMTVVIAFVFPANQGPEVSQVSEALNQAKSKVKILSNAYFRSTLSALGCGRHSVMEYARGDVRSRDTIETDEPGFPILPVVGGTVLVGTAVIFFTGRETECDPVDPAWQLPASLCSDGTPIQLVVTGTPGGIWSGTGVSGTGIFDPSSGTQSVTYTVGEGSCRQSQSQSINVISVDASWTVPSQPCAGEIILLTPSTFSLSHSWSGPGISQNPNGTANFTQSNAGSYTVTHVVTSGSCSATEIHDIAVLPDADASWTVPGTLCAGETTELFPTGTQGGHWTGNGVTDHGNGTAAFFSNTAGSYTITYTAGTGDCEASFSQQIDVLPTPDASWTSPSQPLCVGESATLSPTGTPGGIWSGPGITDHGNGTATFSQNKPGTYAITYTATSGDCDAVSTQDITVISQADPSWSSPGEICSGNSYTLVPTGTPGGTWTGQGITDHGDGTATFIAGIVGATAVTYTAGMGSCEASSTMDIIVIQTPDASWSAPSNALCTEDSYALIPSGTPGGTWTGQGVIDHGNGTATFAQTKAGQYDVTYSVSNGPCFNFSTQTITVISQPDASWITPADVCAGDQVTLVPTGTPGGVWSGNEVTDLGDGTALFTPAEGGVFTITYTIGQGSCEASLSQDLEVGVLPDATWSLPGGICTGQLVTLTPDGTQGGSWSGNGVTDLGNGTAQFHQDKPGFYDVTYTVNSGACTSSLTQSIEVVNQPDPGWTLPTDVCAGQEILLEPDGTSGGTWSGPGVTDLGNGTAHFIQNSGGMYAVTYSVGQGACAQMLTQDIGVTDAGDPSWNPPGDVICPGAVVELVAPEGTWSGEGVTDFGGGVGEFQASNPGIYNITLTVGSANCTASESHDVEVGDDVPPEIDIPASDMTVTCDGNGNITELQDWLDSHGGAEAIDNCSGAVSWEHDFSDFPFDCGLSGNVTVTFTATDDEGNSVTTTGVFTIEDFDPPVLQGVPSDITAPCDNIPPPAPVSASDDCSGNADVVFEESSPGTDCPYEIVRTWTATDDCGNEISAEQVITATDNQAPQPQSIPHDTIINCPGPPAQCIPPPQQIAFTDNCDADPEVQMTEQIQNLPGMIIIIRCWSATDDCGNMSSPVCQQIIIFGNSQQRAPEILLLIANDPEVPVDILAHFTPVNAFWEDPGQTFGEEDIAGEADIQTHVPPISLGLALSLQQDVALLIGAGVRKATLSRHYRDNQDHYTLSGLLHQQSFHLGLRFTPEKMKQVYFITGVQYSMYDITDIRLHRRYDVIAAATGINDSNFSSFIGTGIRFGIGKTGHLNIASNYNTTTASTLYMEIELDITRLLSSLRHSKY